MQDATSASSRELIDTWARRSAAYVEDHRELLELIVRLRELCSEDIETIRAIGNIKQVRNLRLSWQLIDTLVQEAGEALDVTRTLAAQLTADDMALLCAAVLPDTDWCATCGQWHDERVCLRLIR